MTGYGPSYHVYCIVHYRMVCNITLVPNSDLHAKNNKRTYLSSSSMTPSLRLISSYFLSASCHIVLASLSCLPCTQFRYSCPRPATSPWPLFPVFPVHNSVTFLSASCHIVLAFLSCLPCTQFRYSLSACYHIVLASLS
jgi:hypothetical protein